MKINELKEPEIDFSFLLNESSEFKKEIVKILQNSIDEEIRWKKRTKLAEIAEQEGWSEEKYDEECKKRHI